MKTVYSNQFTVVLGEVCRIQFREVAADNTTEPVAQVALIRADAVALAELIMKLEVDLKDREEKRELTN